MYPNIDVLCHVVQEKITDYIQIVNSIFQYGIFVALNYSSFWPFVHHFKMFISKYI